MRQNINGAHIAARSRLLSPEGKYPLLPIFSRLRFTIEAYGRCSLPFIVKVIRYIATSTSSDDAVRGTNIIYSHRIRYNINLWLASSVEIFLICSCETEAFCSSCYCLLCMYACLYLCFSPLKLMNANKKASTYIIHFKIVISIRNYTCKLSFATKMVLRNVSPNMIKYHSV